MLIALLMVVLSTSNVSTIGLKIEDGCPQDVAPLCMAQLSRRQPYSIFIILSCKK
jgi:hypothetical protein